MAIAIAIASCRLGLEPYPCPPMDSVDVRTDTFDLNCQLVGKLPDTLDVR